MARKIRFCFSCCLVAALSAVAIVPAFATEDRWTNTTSGTFNWGPSTTNWSSGAAPVAGDDVRITNNITGGLVITNAGAVNIVANTSTINFMAISNNTAGTTTVIQQQTNRWVMAFGVQLGTNASLILTTNTQFGINNNGLNDTFDLAAGGQKGTLSLSNGNATSFSVFLIKGTDGSTTNAAVNAGTIQFVEGAGQDSGINYGQTLSFTNLSGGTIVKNGVGTGSFVGTFGNNNRAFINDGTILVNAGIMQFDPRNAFTVAFSNTANGKIFIANNATAMVARTDSAWGGGDTIANVGSMTLSGGSFVGRSTDANAIRIYTNNNTGVISGFGTLGWSFRNDAGTLAATGGVLNVLGKIIGAAGTFSAGGAGAGNSGTLLLIGGNGGGAQGTLTGNLIVTNGSAINFTGGSDWTIGAGATVRFANSGLTVAQRGSLISSNSGVGSTLFLANTAFIQNFGTLLVAGASGINFGQIGADGTDMTNRLFMGGIGTFTGNFGGANQGLNNLGTIATGAGLLTIDSRGANHFGGFQNGLIAGDATGQVVIATGGTLNIRRTDAAWFAGGVSPTNLGTINMQGGWLVASNTDFVPPVTSADGGKFVNAAGGIISVTGTNVLDNWRVFQNNGLITIGASSILTNVGNAGGARGTFDNSGGVIELNGGASSLTPAIFVSPNYVSSSASSITNVGGTYFQLKINGTAAAATNNGLMSFFVNTGLVGNTGSVIQVGTDATPQTLVNNGTIQYRITAGNQSRPHMMSNQVVNAGQLILTNVTSVTSANRGDLTLFVTGSSGTAFTNQSTGNISLLALTGGGSGISNVLNVTSGNMVNLGTNTFLQTVQAGSTLRNIIDLSGAGSVYSNAATGRVIVGAGNVGAASIQASRIVNVGTIQVNGGTLALATPNSSTGDQVVENGGTAELAGTLISAGVTNTATGYLRNLPGNNGTQAGALVNLAGGVVEGTNGNLILNAGAASGAGAYRAVAGVGASTLTFAGGGSISALFNTNSTIAVTNSTLNQAGTFIDAGTLVVQGTTAAAAAMTNAVLNVEPTGQAILMGNNALLAVTGNMNMNGGAVIFSNGIGGSLSSALSVGGTFTNTTTSVISNFAGGAMTMNFTANQAVTNNGTIAVTGLTGIGNAATTNLYFSIGTSTANFLVNNGTIVLSLGTATTKTFVFSNQMVNTGTFIVTNPTTAGNGNLPVVTFTGSTRATGGASTNNGTLRMVQSPTGTSGNNSAGTLTFQNGDFVNLGTFAVRQASNATVSANLLESGAVFSNAVGGLVTMESGGSGTFAINAATIANAGIINANDGSLSINGVATGGGTYRAVAGTSATTLTFAGGGSISALFNTNTTLRFTTNAVSGAVLTNANLFVNQGTMVFANGAYQSAAGVTNGPGFLIRTLGTGTNSGTLNAPLVNEGQVLASNGELRVGGAVSGAGAYTAIAVTPGTDVATLTFAGGGSLSSLYNTNSTVFVQDKAWTNAGAFGNAGQFSVSNTTARLQGVVSGAGAYSAIAGAAGTTLTFAGGGSISALFNTGATVRVEGPVLTNDSVFVNGGTVMVVGGRYVNTGNFTNAAGTVATFIDGVGTFSGNVVNGGVWTLDPSTNNIAGNLTVTGTRNLTNSVDIIGGSLSVNAGGAYSLLQTSSVSVAAISTNAGDLALRQSSIGTFTGAAVNSGSFLANSSTAIFGGPLLNTSAGTMSFANDARVIVSGTFTNAGTFSMISGVGTFNGAVVNSGQWITDPTTNVFQNTYTVTSGGYVQMTGGDVFIFTNDASTAASFVNLSSKSNQFDTANGKFLFDNTLGLTQNLVVAGHDLGPGTPNPVPNATNDVQFGTDATIYGFSNNFALGTLEISDFTTVRVTDAFLGLPGLGTNDGLEAGLYLNNLIMGLDSFLIISTNVQVYFKSSNTWDTSNFLLEGNPAFNNAFNGLHQLVVVPEPSVALLWLSGFVTVYAARRRAKKSNL